VLAIMLRLMSYNLLNGGAGRVDPLAEVIRHVAPDVVACPEADVPENFDLLAERLGMQPYWAEAAGPHAVGLLSRLPIVSTANLGRAPMTRTCARVDVQLPAGTVLPVFAVHLTPHLTLEKENVRVEEVRLLLELTAELRADGTPYVLMGDFNATHPAQQVDTTALRDGDRKRVAAQDNLVPRHAIELLIEAGYIDAYHRCHGSDAGYTLSTRRPSLRVDYIFLSPELTEALAACDVHHERLGRYASDHFPVWAELDL